MFTIPLYFFLFAYLFFFVFGWFVFFLINVGHLFATGTFTLPSFFATFLFLAFSAIVIWTTWVLLLSVSWQQPVTLWNPAWLGNTFSSISPFSNNVLGP